MMVSGVEVKNEQQVEIVSLDYYFRRKTLLQTIRATTTYRTDSGYILTETCSVSNTRHSTKVKLYCKRVVNQCEQMVIAGNGHMFHIVILLTRS
jgi:hypothetical protein